MKRLVALFFSVVMLLCFAACESKADKNDSADEAELPGYAERDAISYFEQSYSVKVGSIKAEYVVSDNSGKICYLVSGRIEDLTDENNGDNYGEEYINGYAVLVLMADDGEVFGATNDAIYKESEKADFDAKIDECIEELKEKND